MAQRKRVTRTVRQLRNGQITIPADFRRELGINDDSLLQVTLVGDELRIIKLSAAPAAAGTPWLAELYERFAPVRQEAIDSDYTEEEINEAIDRAVAGARLKRA